MCVVLILILKELDFSKNAKTASEILDQVLGVSFTMPIWAEEKLNEILRKYSEKPADSNTFSNMRSDLESSGLGNLLPEEVIRYTCKAPSHD